MIRRLLKLAEEYQMLPEGGLVLCAVSGGVDSICLLHMLWTLASQEGFSLAAAHYNHQLRGAESMRDQEFVQEWCRERDIPLVTGSGPVAETARSRGCGIEETSRRMRYEFLEKAARDLGADRIATAHTANDNAETVLLHLLRGSGLQGLTGIPPRRGIIVRPLLNCTRSETEAYCEAHDLSHTEDSSNFDSAYSRNFLRLQIMPMLEQINPRAVESISSAAGRLREDARFLDDAASAQADRLSTFEGSALRVPVNDLLQLPPSLRARTVRKLLEQAGAGSDFTAQKLNDMIALCQNDCPSAQISLPGFVVRREYQDLIISPDTPSARILDPVPVDWDGKTSWDGWTLSSRKTDCPSQAADGTIYLDRKALADRPVIRSRQAGDCIKLPGRPRKSLKKLLIEVKVPARQRESLPILADDTGVLAVAGLGPEESRLARPGQAAVEIHWERDS
ncbi:MAG: tRNA lysidine(34) synthetase TilS [Oscillospiraceae bacterium]|nr:tRNA lysidine(34) synthetase TilS [Oscillospiraceae bacterium]